MTTCQLPRLVLLARAPSAFPMDLATVKNPLLWVMAVKSPSLLVMEVVRSQSLLEQDTEERSRSLLEQEAKNQSPLVVDTEAKNQSLLDTEGRNPSPLEKIMVKVRSPW